MSGLEITVIAAVSVYFVSQLVLMFWLITAERKDRRK